MSKIDAPGPVKANDTSTLSGAARTSTVNCAVVKSFMNTVSAGTNASVADSGSINFDAPVRFFFRKMAISQSRVGAFDSSTSTVIVSPR